MKQSLFSQENYGSKTIDIFKGGYFLLLNNRNLIFIQAKLHSGFILRSSTTFSGQCHNHPSAPVRTRLWLEARSRFAQGFEKLDQFLQFIQYSYSVLSVFTGLIRAVFMISLLITISVMKKTVKAGIRNIHQCNRT